MTLPTATTFTVLALLLGVLLGCSGMRHREHRRDWSEKDIDRAMHYAEVPTERRDRVRALAEEMLRETRDLEAIRGSISEGIAENWKRESFDAATLKVSVDAQVENMRTSTNRLIDRLAELHAALPAESRSKLQWHPGAASGHR